MKRQIAENEDLLSKKKCQGVSSDIKISKKIFMDIVCLAEINFYRTEQSHLIKTVLKSFHSW